MAKFKVGDKVRGNDPKRYGITNDQMTLGEVVKVVDPSEDDDICVKIIEHVKSYHVGELFWVHSKYFDLVKPVREFIVIHRDGNVMTAEHRVNREVIKSAKATCAHSDTFDFNTGAKLAFDRLMGREEPKQLFKVGDRVITYIGRGKIIEVDTTDSERPYRIEYEDGCRFWAYSAKAKLDKKLELVPTPQPAHRFKVGDCVLLGSFADARCTLGILENRWNEFVGKELRISFIDGSVARVEGCDLWFPLGSFSPAPEPPKFYTGKVVCVEWNGILKNVLENVLITINDGVATSKGFGRPPFRPYTSFSDFCSANPRGKFIETKEPSDV